MRKNRIQFPTHRPDVQDAQCCAQVGRSSAAFFPHTRIPGSETGYFCVVIAVHDMLRARGHICEGSWEGGSFSGAEHVGKQVILPL